MYLSTIIEQIQTIPFDCLILVHSEVKVLDAAIDSIVGQVVIPGITINKALSAHLLDLPRLDRGRAARRWFENQADSYRPGPLLCFGIDLLFEPSFELDPLAIFRQTSRTTRIAVLWPGSVTNDLLSYAVPEHSHYRTWRLSEIARSSPEVKVFPLSD